ncbi:quinoprotein dehydrogenase-associated SoxYZ-like carrier [Marinobacter salexigens]|uniref:quinoprotein dehydrogenase-associated SoxYZ-like carrier n=1 Tax=Marinobacter salexigens TaxID=1925763 RepID=UPI000C293BAA|nr:quinoprotein dehydrogenase-associated SoxYZ-like carrier [Marinobacter salexigens]
MVRQFLLGALLLLSGAAWAELPADPLDSPLWEYNIERYLGQGANVVVDDRVGLSVPGFAEDSTQVPLTVNLEGFPHRATRVVTWVDMNPVPLLFDAESQDGGVKLVSLNFRVQQASSVRAAVLDEQGVWHIDSGFVDAAGGGCTAPREIISGSDWENEFGTLKTGLFSEDGNTRIKASLLHPMDSGMVGNVPAFFVGNVEVREEGSDAVLLAMTLAESASENPMFVFEFEGKSKALAISMEDNNGYRFEGAIGGEKP